jgi:hypothetical protein
MDQTPVIRGFTGAGLAKMGLPDYTLAPEMIILC